MSSIPFLPSEVDVSELVFGDLKPLDSGAKTFPIKYKGANLTLELPSLLAPFGVNVFQQKPTDDPKVTVDLCVNAERSEAAAALKEFLEALYERLVEHCVENSAKMFRKPAPTNERERESLETFVRDKCKSNLKYSIDAATGVIKDYPPNFKCSLRKRKGADAKDTSLSTFQIDCYDGTNELAPFDGDVKMEEIIPKRAVVGSIVECTGGWLSSVGCGLSFKMTQARVDERPAQVRGPAFRDAGDIKAWSAARKAAPAAAPAPAADSVFAAVLPAPKAEDEAPAPAPPPAKAPKVKPEPEPEVVEPEAEEEVEAPIPVPKPKPAVKKVKKAAA